MDISTRGNEQRRSPSQFACEAEAAPLGVRRLRIAAGAQLAAWGWPAGSEVAQRVALVVAELGANAATHGARNGAVIVLRLGVLPDLDSPEVVQVEVLDGRGDVVPRSGCPSVDAVCGRGLLLVAAVARRWGWYRTGVEAKTVWAEVPVR
ncbi:ATP-binding protein [Yinghuangia sp. YIM S09857]|uniref:ATP-binding protein n=1 Tax=Yinghuangia sp. YIM S09857 TaxID=3436929 RepID=UPI003F52D1A3